MYRGRKLYTTMALYELVRASGGAVVTPLNFENDLSKASNANARDSVWHSARMK